MLTGGNLQGQVLNDWCLGARERIADIAQLDFPGEVWAAQSLAQLFAFSRTLVLH